MQNLVDPVAGRSLWQQVILRLFIGIRKSPAFNLDTQTQRFLTNLLLRSRKIRATASRAQALLNSPHIVRPWPSLDRILDVRSIRPKETVVRSIRPKETVVTFRCVSVDAKTTRPADDI